MWRSKLLKQAGICAVILAAVAFAGKVDIPVMNRGSEEAVAYLSKHYTIGDIIDFTKDSAAAVIKAPVSLTNRIISVHEEDSYGAPVNRAKEGETVSVYAAQAGTVSEVGENSKFGKFIKIIHGDDAESVYGNCKQIYVKETDRVKKGQMIASFRKENNIEFYYSLKKRK